MAAPDLTQGCLFFADGGAHGTQVFTTQSSSGPSRRGMAGGPLNFNQGDTIIVNVLDAYDVANNSFIITFDGLPISFTQSTPGEFRYTFPDDVVTTVYIDITLSSGVPGIMLYQFTFNCISGKLSADNDGVKPPDNRINWQSGDSHIGILYPNGSSIAVYSYDLDNYYSNFISEQQLEIYADNPPTENTLINSIGNISVYILTSGEIQFNLGPDAEGKEYVIIMDDLSGTNLRTFYYDPNE